MAPSSIERDLGYLSEWLSPNALSKERLEHILSDKELPYYVHQIAA
jgi:hypothetical protein